MRKIRKLVMDKKGMSYPLTVALVLAFADCVMCAGRVLPAFHYRLWGTECLAGIRYIRGDHQL